MIMEEIRTLLLENALDALDRLFDSECRAIDIYVLTYATGCALSGDILQPLFHESAEALQNLAHKNLPAKDLREKALEVTDDLRIALADALPWPPS